MPLNYLKKTGGKLFWFLTVCVVAGMVSLGAQAGEPAEPNTPVFQDRLFGMASIQLPNTAHLEKWNAVLQRHASEDKVATPALNDWHNFVAALKGKDKRIQLEEINRYVNRVPYVADEANYGRVDHWATPAEMFARGGDCEDYAITKFLALRALGFDNDEMRLVVVQDVKRHIAHAVLVVDIDGETLTLDNLIWKVAPTKWIDHYRPLYSVNVGNMWMHRV